MMSLKELLKKRLQASNTVHFIRNLFFSIDEIKIQNGKILNLLSKNRVPEIIQNIHQAEFRVFSQWGDDGIIQFLVDYLQINQKTFVEFGVQNYFESNTRFLMVNNNWKGLIMDGSNLFIKQIKRQKVYWRYDLKAVNAFIDKDNINRLLSDNGFTGELGLLHIDIDGNDYWILKEITVVYPIILIMEYNSVFGIENAWTVPYESKFYRTRNHYSNLYFGASLLALCDLAAEKGYAFVGCNSNGNNAYFIRKDKISGLRELTPSQGFVESRFRESRNQNGDMNYLSGVDRLNAIKDMEIYNTRTKKIETI